jgi:hypothetical protein
MVWLYPLRDKLSREVAPAVANWLANNGSPKSFYSDNGGEFAGDTKDLCDRRTPPVPIISGRAYHPETQGSIERANQSFKRKLSVKWSLDQVKMHVVEEV